MAIKLRMEDAESAGFARATAEQVSESRALPGGIHLEGFQDGDVCYIGPCRPHISLRLVCYYRSDVGCQVCYLEPDSSCGPT
jgi:hypothetical protein